MSTTSQQSRSPQGGFNSVTESFDSLRVWYAALCCRYELLPMAQWKGVTGYAHLSNETP